MQHRTAPQMSIENAATADVAEHDQSKLIRKRECCSGMRNQVG